MIDPESFGPVTSSIAPPASILGVMTKYWRPGQVKTRLAADVGDQRAADLHRHFLHHLSVGLAAAGRTRQWVAALLADQHLFRQQLKRWGLASAWSIVDQGQGDLGQRMSGWFERTLKLDDSIQPSGASAILIGADCLGIDEGVIAEAANRLADADIVLGPAIDGGYYLIGAAANERTRGRIGSLFTDVPWSTKHVLSITISRCEAAGLRVVMLEPREDVDTIDELNRLRASLADGDERAAELLAAIDAILNSDPSSTHCKSETV